MRGIYILILLLVMFGCAKKTPQMSSQLNIEFLISLDEDNIVMRFNNLSEYPVYISNPACWNNTYISLLDDSGFLIPSIRVKPNLKCGEEIIYRGKRFHKNYFSLYFQFDIFKLGEWYLFSYHDL